jgi:hypothetical protein
MKTPILSSPAEENFADFYKSERFYRLYLNDFIDFCQKKYAPAVMKIYYFIKVNDPFSNGLSLNITEVARVLKYHKRTVSRAIKTLIKSGELAVAVIEAHVKIVATAVQSKTEIVSKLGLVDIPAPESPVVEPIETPTPEPSIPVRVVTAPITPPVAPEPPIAVEIVEIVEIPIPTPPVAPEPQQTQRTPAPPTGISTVGDIISKLGFAQPTATEAPTTDTDSTFKTPEWYAKIESRLNVLDIKLADVHHALKKYSIQAIEDGIKYTQKQTWSKAKAGVFVNYLKKWTPTSNPIRTAPKSKPERVVTALMKRFPDIANTLSKEENPIDEATLDYLERLKVAELIHNVHYSSIHNFFGVFITSKDYPHPIPWWDAVPQLQQLYPAFD